MQCTMIEEMISCPWSETPSDLDTELSDDWFYKSISMYKHLLMYNLPVQPEAVVLEAGGDLLALTGPNPRCSTKHEISVYRLPSKLLCTSEQDEGLNNSRDFKLLSGSIVRTPVHKLQFNPQGQLISSDGEPNLQIWNMQEAGEDVLEDGGQIKSNLKIADFYVDHDTACITDRSTVELIDLQSEVKTLEVCSPCTGAVRVHKKNSTVFIGSSNGEMKFIDVRSGNIINQEKLPQGDWSLDLTESGSGVSLLALNAQGELYGVEETASAIYLGRIETGLSAHVLTTCKQTQQFAVHAHDQVKVYDNSCKLIFNHEGHSQYHKKTRIKSSVFHPTLPNTVISSDMDKNLQLWQFNP